MFPPYVIFLFFPVSVVPCLSLYFIKLDVLTVPFESASLSKNTQRAIFYLFIFLKKRARIGETVVPGAKASHSLNKRLSDENNVLKQKSSWNKWKKTLKLNLPQLDAAKILLAEFKLATYSDVSV